MYDVNCGIYGPVYGATANAEYNNVYKKTGSADSCYYFGTYQTFVNNASSDATGTVGLRNLVATTELESVDRSSGYDFLKPKFTNTTLKVAPSHIDIMENNSLYVGAKGNQDPLPVTCWNFTAKFKGLNRLYRVNGPGDCPDYISIPKNVDPDSGVMIEHGLKVSPNRYRIIQ